MRIELKKGKLSSGIVGLSTGSGKQDFYVYEWYLIRTGEVFYIGKGRADRYKEYHENAKWAERIRDSYETGCRFIVENVSEEEALIVETEEITRVLEETSDVLTNKATPIGVKRSGIWYKPCKKTPPLSFETAPVMYVTEIEEHYFGRECRRFESVTDDLIKGVHFINDAVSKEENDALYGSQYEKYYKDVVRLCEQRKGTKIISTKFAKSVTAFVYSGTLPLEFYENMQEEYLKTHGRHFACIHLIDLWKFLKSECNASTQEQTETALNSKSAPQNKRCPITEIRNYGNWQKGFEEGSAFCFMGDQKRKAGQLDAAIELFDLARYNGYIVPYLYECYAKTYRKMKDTENEIAILKEAEEQMSEQGMSNKAIMFAEQRRKAESRKR